MVIDNFTLLMPHMIFHESLFYFIQIIKRYKDKGNEDMERRRNRVIKSYFIDKPLSDETQNEIKMLAKIFNARVYINLAPCSKEKVIKLIASKMFSKVLEQQFDNFTEVINSAAGDSITAYKKLFLIDIDTKNEETINQITDFINRINPVEIKDKVVVKVPTINGVHLICQPFNTKVFKDNYPGIDIHKHNPTLLYYNLK